MLCSNCSAVVNPVVVFDIDGVLGDYHGDLINFAMRYTGITVDHEIWPYRGDMNFGDWMMDSLGIVDRRTYRDVKLAWRQGGHKRWMTPFRDMIEAVRYAWADMAAEVWLATTRPYNRLDSVDPDTKEWLRRNEVPYDHLLYGDNKYETLAENLDPGRVVFVLDDLVEMYDRASIAFQGPDRTHPAYLRAGEYNTAMDRPQKIYTANEAKLIIKNRITEWEQKWTPQEQIA